MFTVELYAKVRRAVMIEGLSRREAAKRFGLHRNTITKMLSFSVPPGYRRRERPASKKLGPHMAWIDAILEGDSQVHKKQRHTARRIFERLRDEQGFSGGYTIVRSSLSLVRYKNNDYSASTRYGPQEVLAKGYVDRVEIVCRGETIAVHPRSYETADFIYNPLHYLALLEQKTKALDQAAPLDEWRLADCIHRLRRLMEARMGSAGWREFIQVLRLMEDFHQHQVEQAVSEALRLGAISFDAVKMLLLARLENRPARLDLTFYPYLPVDNRSARPILASSPAQAPFLWQRGHGMSLSQETAAPAIVAPQVLLSNHLKALKLPTFAREYEKVAMESAQTGRLPALSAAPVRTGAHRSRAPQRGAPDSAGALSADQELRYVRLRRPAVAEQGAGSGTDTLRVDRQAPELPCSWAIRNGYCRKFRVRRRPNRRRRWPEISSARSRTPSSMRSPNGRTGRWSGSMRWCSSTPSGSRCATKAWCATRPSTSLSGFDPTEPRKSSADRDLVSFLVNRCE